MASSLERENWGGPGGRLLLLPVCPGAAAAAVAGAAVGRGRTRVRTRLLFRFLK